MSNTLTGAQRGVGVRGEWEDNRVGLVGMAEDVVVLFGKVRHHVCSAGASEQRSNFGGCSAKTEGYYRGQKCRDNARRPMTSDHIENWKELSGTQHRLRDARG